MNPKPQNEQKEIGYVTKVRDFLTRLDGLPTVRINDMVESDTGLRGWISTLGLDFADVLMLDEGQITPRQMFKRTNSRLGVGTGDFLLGRAINPLGIPIDGKGMLTKTSRETILDLEQGAPGIESREYITRQFLTGITLIDTLIPLGQGQRELVMGDAHSGKTQFLVDTIVNQKGTGVICIYASIGKPAVSVRGLINILRANKALDYTVVIATSSSEPAPLIFLTPKTAVTVAEYFQKQGRDVLLILDDLGNHAKIYREISLLGNKSPGRESYPGDIFYQHAHLLERAGNFTPQAGGGSITALPVIELNMTDFTTLIPTNLMSMTDGHLLFKSSLRSQGQSPAIDISLSVSRVGRQTQDKVSNLISAKVRQVLSQAADLETISRFSSELSEETQLTLKRGILIMELLKQEPLTAIPKQIQVALLALPFITFFNNKNKTFLEKYKKIIIQAFLTNPQLSQIAKGSDKFKTDDELIKALEDTTPILQKLCP
ncbi:F0F1 ATP synthase subunit alpha [Candidatus Daviesbacteria bacterium]|nr:F0F1 ATP synthase subunit alpha [Candidatus Daviesbacteria bacterium]